MPDPVNGKGIQRARLRGNGLGAGRGMGHQFGDHRIIIDRDFPAFENTRVITHGHRPLDALLGRTIGDKTPRRGQEIARRVFGIDTAFDRPAIEFDILLLERELFAPCHADHLLDEINAGDHFRDGMFDLQARIHFQKEEALVLACDKFNRARGIITHRFAKGHGLLTHFLAGGLVEQR